MAKQQKTGFTQVAKEYYGNQPQEMLMPEPVKAGEKLSFGLPCEGMEDEKRIALTPEAVAILVNNGAQVLVEKGAGIPSKLADNNYSEAGAEIVYTAKEAFQADVVLKVAPPTVKEVELMRPQKTIISSLGMNTVSAAYLKAANAKKITGLSFELLEDDKAGLPIVRAMSEIAGSTVMLVAAEYLSSFNDGKGLILGGIAGVPPTRVVIIGAGTVAEYAARTALGLGAEVRVFDNQIYRLRRIRERLSNNHLYTSTIDSASLSSSLSTCDVAIGALRGHKRSPIVVTEDMVQMMRPNSVIIDVTIDQGGCFETSEITDHFRPSFRKFDVIHYCVPNIAARVASTASTAISNIITPMLLELLDRGRVDEMIMTHQWFTKGVYAYHGSLTNKPLADKFRMNCRNLNLIMAARLG